MFLAARGEQGTGSRQSTVLAQRQHRKSNRRQVNKIRCGDQLNRRLHRWEMAGFKTTGHGKSRGRGGGWSSNWYFNCKPLIIFYSPSLSLSQTNPSGQHWCFWAVCVSAFSSHCAPSSSRYTVEQTATTETITTLTIAAGTGIITAALTAVPTTSPVTVIQTALLLLRLEGPGLPGTASRRTGMTHLTCRHDDAGASRELCCTPPCSHQPRVQAHTDAHIKTKIHFSRRSNPNITTAITWNTCHTDHTKWKLWCNLGDLSL